MKIAISGPSACGKSTLSKMLASKHKMTHLCLDDFWICGNDRKFFLNKDRCYELADGYNGKELARRAWEIGPFEHIILEGLHIMAFPEVRKLVDFHFYIDTPWDVCVTRRVKRSREKDLISTNLWLKLGERFNELNVGFQRDLKNTIVLDGTQPTEILVDQLTQKISLALSKDDAIIGV